MFRPCRTLAVALLVAVSATNPASADLSETDRQSHVFFPNGGTTLDATARAKIDRVAAVLNTRRMSGACIALVGHSDSSGSSVINQSISERRAEAVAAELRARLNDRSRVLAVLGRGEDAPLATIVATAPEQRRVAILARDCPLP